MEPIQELWRSFIGQLGSLTDARVEQYKTPGERTKVMLGTSKDRSTGLVQNAIAQVFAGAGKPSAKPEDGRWSYERYHDACWGGQDYKARYETGEAYNDVIAEVENGVISPSSGDYSQVQKLMNWLMNTQAHYKWAILYYNLASKRGVSYDSVSADAGKIKEVVEDVAANFKKAGFLEAQETQYLLSIGPSVLDAGDRVRGWSAVRFQHEDGNLTVWESL